MQSGTGGGFRWKRLILEVLMFEKNFTFCEGERCGIRRFCKRYVNGKGIVKENTDGARWIECCDEYRELYLDINK